MCFTSTEFKINTNPLHQLLKLDHFQRNASSSKIQQHILGLFRLLHWTKLPCPFSPSWLSVVPVIQYLVRWLYEDACGPLLNAGLHPAHLSHFQCLFWASPPTTLQSLSASKFKAQSTDKIY